MSRYYLQRVGAFALVFALATWGGSVRAQGPGIQGEDMLWNLTPPQHSTSAIVQVELDHAVGTGVIILVDRDKAEGDGFSGFCLTAQHVVADDGGRRAIRVRYVNGKVAKRCKVVQSDEENDVALLWVWVPKDIEPAPVAKRSALKDEWVYFAGLGGGAPLEKHRYFGGRAAPPTSDRKIFSPVSLLPGDSGGPVFNKQGEVLGVVSGGWMWFATDRPHDTNGMNATWPARACNLGAVRKLVKDATLNADSDQLTSIQALWRRDEQRALHRDPNDVLGEIIADTHPEPDPGAVASDE